MGPAQMTAEPGGSLTVSCSYKRGYKLYSENGCRRAFLFFCFTYITQTNGSEVTVTQGRVSIRDHHSARSFTMTLGSVKLEDAGWYFCRVMKSRWFSPQHITEVMVSTGKARLRSKARVCNGACHLGQSAGDRATPARGTPGLSKREQAPCRH